MVTRRVALKQLAVLSAGAALISSCMPKKESAHKLFKNVNVTDELETLISSISETLLPKSTTPGATDVGASHFTARMVDDCLSKKDQEKWMVGLTKFFELVKTRDSKPFSEWSKEDREKLLTEFEEKKIEGEEVNFFYKTVRRFSVQAYTSSEYFMTHIQNYNIIPGPFKGCVPVNSPS